MLRLIAKSVLAVSSIALLSTVTPQRAAGEGTVTGNGEVTLRPLPSVLRMQVQLQSRGSTVEAALARLKDRHESAVEKLKTLEADLQTITFGPPAVSKVSAFPVPASPYSPSSAPSLVPMPSTPSPPRSYPAPSTYPSTAYPPPPPVSPRPVNVPSLFNASATLTVDLPLDADDLERALIVAEGLKKKIRAADVAGIKEPDQLSLEENEIAEEAAGTAVPHSPPVAVYAPSSPMYRPPSTEHAPVTEPPQPARYPTQSAGYVPAPAPTWVPSPPQRHTAQFFFVATISPQQRKEALAGAFAKARAKARELAEAAGLELGPLVSLDGWIDDREQPGPVVYFEPPVLDEPFRGSAERIRENEAGAVDPAAIRFTCQVNATFRLL